MQAIDTLGILLAVATPIIVFAILLRDCLRERRECDAPEEQDE